MVEKINVRSNFKTKIGYVETPAQRVKGGFWADVDGGSPVIHRFRERMFIGDATKFNSVRAGAGGAWLPNGAAGAGWSIRDAQFGVMQSRGGPAVVGIARASDGDDVPFLATGGVFGLVLNDSAEGRAAWALYADVQHEPIGISTSTYALECAVKNKSSDITGNPYALGGGAIGVWLAGGGDSVYGGSPTHPSNAAIVILKNSHTWNRGIIFSADSLTGTDGTTGTAIAVEMAKGHTIRWLTPSANSGGSIRSDVSISGRDVSLVFENHTVEFFGHAGVNLFFAQHDPNSAIGDVNYLVVNNKQGGGAPSIEARGSDTDVDLLFTPKGAGVVRFGAHTGTPLTISGYITIKDSGGASRKLAVVS